MVARNCEGKFIKLDKGRSIWVPSRVHDLLNSKRLCPREPFYSVIMRLVEQGATDGKV